MAWRWRSTDFLLNAPLNCRLPKISIVRYWVLRPHSIERGSSVCAMLTVRCERERDEMLAWRAQPKDRSGRKCGIHWMTICVTCFERGGASVGVRNAWTVKHVAA